MRAHGISSGQYNIYKENKGRKEFLLQNILHNYNNEDNMPQHRDKHKITDRIEDPDVC